VQLRKMTKTIVPTWSMTQHTTSKDSQNYSMRSRTEERYTYLCKDQSNEDDLKANRNSRAVQEFVATTSSKSNRLQQTCKQTHKQMRADHCTCSIRCLTRNYTSASCISTTVLQTPASCRSSPKSLRPVLTAKFWCNRSRSLYVNPSTHLWVHAPRWPTTPASARDTQCRYYNDRKIQQKQQEAKLYYCILKSYL
jgi:hypothetical protein